MLGPRPKELLFGAAPTGAGRKCNQIRTLKDSGFIASRDNFLRTWQLTEWWRLLLLLLSRGRSWSSLTSGRRKEGVCGQGLLLLLLLARRSE